MACRHAYSSARALYNAFIVPALVKDSTRRTFLRQPTHLSPIGAIQQHRSFVKNAPPSARQQKPERTQKWNEEITARYIILVHPETGKLEDQPTSKNRVLDSLDFRRERLVQMSPNEPENPDFTPVCKIIDAIEADNAEKERKRQQKDNVLAQRKLEKEQAKSSKTLELNWAIDQNDLGHRLKRMEEFLAAGRRVEVVLAAKKRGRKATPQECEQLLERVYKAVEGVSEAKVLKKLDGKVGGFATMAFGGKGEGRAAQGES